MVGVVSWAGSWALATVSPKAHDNVRTQSAAPALGHWVVWWGQEGGGSCGESCWPGPRRWGFKALLCHFSALLFLKRFPAPGLGFLIRKMVPGCSEEPRHCLRCDGALGLFIRDPTSRPLPSGDPQVSRGVIDKIVVLEIFKCS